MSERDTDFPASTENSVSPHNSGTDQNPPVQDFSRSTAEFRAFANRPGSDPEPAWSMKAPRRKVALLAVAVLVVAIVLAVIAIAVLSA